MRERAAALDDDAGGDEKERRKSNIGAERDEDIAFFYLPRVLWPLELQHPPLADARARADAVDEIVIMHLFAHGGREADKKVGWIGERFIAREGGAALLDAKGDPRETRPEAGVDLVERQKERGVAPSLRLPRLDAAAHLERDAAEHAEDARDIGAKALAEEHKTLREGDERFYGGTQRKGDRGGEAALGVGADRGADGDGIARLHASVRA